MVAEPMVTIKKADGTTERVPLSQVKKQKNTDTPKTSAPVSDSQKATTPPPPQKEKKSAAQEVKSAQTNPVAAVTPKPSMPPTKVAPASPPPPAMPKQQPTPLKVEKKEVAPVQETVLPKSPMSPAFPKVQKHYPSFDRQAPVKQTARQAINTARQPDISHTPKPRTAPHQWDANDHVSLLDESLHTDLPMVVDASKMELSTTTPVKDIFKDEAVAQMHHAKMPLPPRSAPPARPLGTPTPLSIRGAKPQLHDVRPGSAMSAIGGGLGHPPQPVKRSMGPVDELASMTTEDFRRFGANALAMKEIFMSKFLGLRKESFMIYSDGVRAWRKSPLFAQYLRVISSSLQKNQPVDAVLTEDGGLTKEEFEALIEVNMHLGM